MSEEQTNLEDKDKVVVPPTLGDGEVDFTEPYVEEDDNPIHVEGEQATDDKSKATEDENTNGEDEPFDFTKVELKGKWNDEEIPVTKMLEKALKFAQENPDDATVKDIIGNVQKAYDYTHVAELKKEVKANRDFYNAVQLENYAMKYGEAPLEAILDTLAEINGEPEEVDGKKVMVFSNREDYIKYKNQEKELYQNYQAVVQNKQQTAQENAVMFEDFSKKYPTVPVKALVEDVQTYLNPTVTLGQVPFPKDALEVFYKGKNFDKLADERVKEAVANVYKELGIKQGKSEKKIVNTVKEKTKVKEDDGGFDEGIDEFMI